MKITRLASGFRVTGYPEIIDDYAKTLCSVLYCSPVPTDEMYKFIINNCLDDNVIATRKQLEDFVWGITDGESYDINDVYFRFDH
jgi:hypothetical protein